MCQETISMKCQNLFSEKKKKKKKKKRNQNISVCHLLKILPRVLMVEALIRTITDNIFSFLFCLEK